VALGGQLRETDSFLQQLGELYRLRRPGRKAVDGFELYLVDLSEWRLRFSERTPLIRVKAEATEGLSTIRLAESLRDIAQGQGWRRRDCLVLLDSDGQRLKARLVNQYFPRFVVIDAGEQQGLLASPSFTGGLLDLVCEQIPISSLAPYQVGAPVEGSAFFGREHEIDRILRRPETNFAIVGVRRIGKTSLLKEARRRLQEQGEDPSRIVWLDCSTLSSLEHFTQEIVRELNPRELPRLKKKEKYFFYFAGFLKRMSKMHGGPITVFLDEADQLLAWAREVPEEWELLPTLRASASAGHCRYVIAGFRLLMNELYNNHSPFFLAFEPLTLGPFARRETAEVITRPMNSLRVRFENEREVVSRIYAETRGHPLLVQYYCLELLNQLEKQGSRTLSLSSLADIYTSPGFQAQIINAFRDNVNNPDKVLVYALLTHFPEDKETFSPGEIYGALQRHGAHFSAEKIDRTCERLVLAGVLAREGPRHRFANPIFPRILRANYDLDHLLSVAKKEAGV
jgi:hypothetical protein